jgi:hypothetical protein
VTPLAWAVLWVVVGWGFTEGLAFRLGRLRKMGRWYGVEALPTPIRTMPLQLVPLFRPARLLKPDWLRMQEQRQGDHSQAGSRSQKA